MTSVLTACGTSQPDSTVTNRLKQPVAAHAKAVSGDDVAKMRETGLALIELMGAAFNWAFD